MPGSNDRFVHDTATSSSAPDAPLLPPFEQMWTAYPRGEVADVKKLVGGNVDADWITNTCAIRMSRAFNYAGQPIPKDFALPHDKTLATVRGGDDLRYAFRVAELKAYLEARYGMPTKIVEAEAGGQGVDADDFRGYKGVIVFDVKGWDDATGHIDLWDGEAPAGHAYFERAHRVALWRAV